jgi:hypothetical protein
MAWGKKKKEDPGTPSVSIAVSEVMVVKSKYESDGYYSVTLEHRGSILDKFVLDEVKLRPRSQGEFDVYEVGQRVTIGVQPWLTTPVEDAVDVPAWDEDEQTA